MYFTDVHSERVCGDLIFEIDCLFRKSDQWPLSEIPDQMTAMSKRPGKTEDQDAGDLALRMMGKKKRKLQEED